MDPTELERAVAKRADISAGKVGDVLSALRDVLATEGDSHDDIALRRLVVEGFVRPKPWQLGRSPVGEGHEDLPSQAQDSPAKADRDIPRRAFKDVVRRSYNAERTKELVDAAANAGITAECLTLLLRQAAARPGSMARDLTSAEAKQWWRHSGVPVSSISLEEAERRSAGARSPTT